ncbi:MAG: V-type ATP synthase subunit F [Lachnospiraceae bacterium]|nr:V-type ATP synthase subunit F [Lachnospiraceae bacterium]
MHKIAVMGDRDSIYGFAALGMEPFPITDATEAARQLHKMVEEDYAVIYMTEALGSKLSKELDRYREYDLPAIILIPGTSGNTGAGMEQVRRSVIQAVGSDIIFGEDK